MKKKFKRLYFDIETSPNLVHSWRVGYDININHDNIVKERAIICICYKWEHERSVKFLTWDKGCDKKMLEKFIKIMNAADEVCGHNGDKFDIKWVRTRCIYHNIPAFPDYKSIDTLKLSRKGFNFNSNKLDYIAQFLGIGRKLKTGGYDLWKTIVLNNDSKALTKMVKYCKKDVLLLEQVFKRLSNYTYSKTHVGVLMGNDKDSCPSCGSEHTKLSNHRVTAKGIRMVQLKCVDCGKYHSITESVFNKARAEKEDKSKV